MLTKICHAPVNTYFDVTPSGLILNRFSKDLQTCENVLPNSIKRQTVNIVSIAFSFAFAAYNVIWILLFIPIMLLLCYRLLSKYKLSLKEGARLDSVSSSPILTHISESVSGTSTIRAYDKTDDFTSKQFMLQDSNTAALLMRRGVQCWFNTRITFLLALFLSFVYIYCVIVKDGQNSVLIGLMMVYLMDVQANLIKYFRLMALVDARMVNFERLFY